jgi:phosphatidylinositol glycan class V
VSKTKALKREHPLTNSYSMFVCRSRIYKGGNEDNSICISFANAARRSANDIGKPTSTFRVDATALKNRTDGGTDDETTSALSSSDVDVDEDMAIDRLDDDAGTSSSIAVDADKSIGVDEHDRRRARAPCERTRAGDVLLLLPLMLDLSTDERQMARFALISRGAVLGLSAVAVAMVPAYDQSTALLSVAPTWMSGLASWDAVYMRHIATYGYTHEQTHAFFPFFPRLLLAPASHWLSVDPVLVAVVVNNFIAFPIAAVILYRLSLVLLGSAGRARWAAFAFLVSPASVFFSAAYTESCFALASFLGMLAVVRRARFPAFLAFLAAAALRSNGVLYGGFFLWPHVHRFFVARRLDWRALPLDLLATAGLFAPTVAMELYGRSLYCHSAVTVNDRPYCHAPLWRPALYSFVQSHYWNQGFLRYWTLQQVPNFLLAAPMAILCAHACMTALRERDFLRRDARAPFVLLLGVMLVFAVLSSHVQTLTRFVSANPVVYWSASAPLSEKKQRAWAMEYFLVYAVTGTVMFSTFYPWT